MSACYLHPVGERRERADGYTECVPCRRERRRQYRARARREARVSTPNKLTPTDRALLYAFADLDLYSRRDLAAHFDISESRLYALLRERGTA